MLKASLVGFEDETNTEITTLLNAANVISALYNEVNITVTNSSKKGSRNIGEISYKLDVRYRDSEFSIALEIKDYNVHDFIRLCTVIFRTLATKRFGETSLWKVRFREFHTLYGESCA